MVEKEEYFLPVRNAWYCYCQLTLPVQYNIIILPSCHQVEQLTNHLKEKTDKCSELLLSKEQLQRDVQERNEEIEKLECRIRELEQALIISADHLQKVFLV